MSNVEYNAKNPFESDAETDVEEVPLDHEAINPFEDSQQPPALPSKPRDSVPPLPQKVKEKLFPEQRDHSTSQAPPPLPRKEAGIEVNQPPQKYIKDKKIIEDLNSPIELTAEGVRRKELELKRREEDIQRREEALFQQEQKIGKPRPKNWPRCRPILHHDIAGEIPEDLQPLVRRAYWAWYGIQIALCWNFISVAAGLFADASHSGAIAGFFIGLVIWLVSVPMSWFVYRFLYNAARKTKPSLYMIFFIFVWLEILVFGYLALGVDGWGGGGFFFFIGYFNDKKPIVGIFGVVDFALWVLLIVIHVYLFFKARSPYSAAGGVEKAKQEAATYSAKKMAENPELTAKAAKAAYSASV